MRRVVILAGGVGGSRFTLGVREALRRRGEAHEITVIANTGDDLWLSGVRLQPDIDSLLYALAGVNDTARGWGRAGDTERVNAELQAWGGGWPWFTLGDLDLGTHLARTGWLRDGTTVSEVVARLNTRWDLGARILPMTDTEVDTIVHLQDGSRMHFQEWWTRHRATLAPARFVNPGIEDATPAAGVVAAIENATDVFIAPSNPVVSIGPILGVPGIREALALAPAPVVGVSPVIDGAVVRGMADVCLPTIGVETSAAAIAGHYGARDRGGLLDAWLMAEEDSAFALDVAAGGIDALVVPLWMRDADSSAALGDAALSVRDDEGLPG